MKRFLLLQACGHADEENEAKSIEAQAKLYGMETINKCVKNSDELSEVLYNNGEFDYVYLSSHGNAKGFANETFNLSMSWKDLGEIICDSGCLSEGSIILLSCCRGGLNEVAYSMFYTCNHIEYVIGPRQSLTSSEMLIAYSILLFNIENRDIDAVISCHKVLKGCDIRLKCFDRLEVCSDLGYIEQHNKWDIEEEYLSEGYNIVDGFEIQLELSKERIESIDMESIKAKIVELNLALASKDFNTLKNIIAELKIFWTKYF